MMKSESLAPIVLFVYNRLSHTQATVEALQKNDLSKQSELFIYSDGWKSESTKKDIQLVRNYLKTIQGFKRIEIIEKDKNYGLSVSVITGVTEVLNHYDKVIVLEDDLICSSDFLLYMNQALTLYKEDVTLYSISGYTFPSPYLQQIRSDVFLYPRPASWGWGTWKNRWEKADWTMSDFPTFSHDHLAIRSFLRGGEDMFMMLLKQQKGLIQSWAIRWSYVHFKNKAYSLYPTKSKIRSIGTDSSGTNLPSTKKYDTSVHEGQLQLMPQLLPDEELIFRLKDFYKPSVQRRLINWFKFGKASWLKANK